MQWNQAASDKACFRRRKGDQAQQGVGHGTHISSDPWGARSGHPWSAGGAVTLMVGAVPVELSDSNTPPPPCHRIHRYGNEVRMRG